MEQEGTPLIDQGTTQDRASPSDAASSEPQAIDFVRFCYKRRHVGWPELYDEMCAVAGRGLYHGFCADDLNRIGIGFALYEMPALATIVHRVVAEDQERRRLSIQASRIPRADAEALETPEPIPSEPAPAEQPENRPRLVAVSAGAT
jgi:hypothetical protein